jgi:prepilin-type N-terminal cleavage/methylation domain-containing protein
MTAGGYKSFKGAFMNSKGITLVEVLVAVLILAVGALALAQLFVAGVAVNARTKDDTQISTVAQQYLESLSELGYSGLVVGGNLNTPQAGYSAEDVVLENSSTTSDSKIYHQNAVTYDVYWEITEGTPIADVPYREVAVRVVCNRLEFGGAPREVIIRTQISRPYAVL